MAVVARLLSPVAPFVLDHGCHAKLITHRSHPVLRITRTLASPTNWDIEVSRGLLPQTSLADVADLLAAAFKDSNGDYEDQGLSEEEEQKASSNPIKIAEDFNYKLRLMAALQFRGLTEGRQFIAVLARSPATGSLAGVVTLAPGLGPADAEGHLNDLPEGQTIGSISNMAVEENSRRRGLGKILLETAELAAGSWPAPPSVYVLTCYKTNEAAIQLYKNSRYVVDDSWTDPKWLHAAERGLASGLRRVLMIKNVEAWETDESEPEE